jgi:hypothetical protein
LIRERTIIDAPVCLLSDRSPLRTGCQQDIRRLNEGSGIMTATAAQVRRARAAALDDLDWHWGEAYDLAVTKAGWVAKRLDNGRSLVAGSPAELRALITADYAATPVSRDLPAEPMSGEL